MEIPNNKIATTQRPGELLGTIALDQINAGDLLARFIVENFEKKQGIKAIKGHCFPRGEETILSIKFLFDDDSIGEAEVSSVEFLNWFTEIDLKIWHAHSTEDDNINWNLFE